MQRPNSRWHRVKDWFRCHCWLKVKAVQHGSFGQFVVVVTPRLLARVFNKLQGAKYVVKRYRNKYDRIIWMQLYPTSGLHVEQFTTVYRVLESAYQKELRQATFAPDQPTNSEQPSTKAEAKEEDLN